ncbi:MAG: rubrerythrin [Peptococcaceae bacterium BRH_c4b]|nr:MAG: rubrerythrin [Peptococcaceae bacterium BRH_c4b]
MAWSILKFTGDEIVKLAVEIEKNGRLFYEKALAKVDDPDAKRTFIYLAEEEARHVKDFEKLGESLARDVVPNESYVGEYRDYIKSIIDSHVFNLHKVKDLVDGIQTFREALAIAFRFEKDSIMIFQEFKNMVDDTGKDIIEKLIQQEKEHISKLTQIYRQP